MAVRITARRIAPLAAVFALGALGLATPALASPAPVKEVTSIDKVVGTLTVATAPGVNDHLTARLNGSDGPGDAQAGQTLTFTTVATANTPATLLCTAVTMSDGVGSCDALVGLDPKAIQGAGLAQIAAKGSFTVAFAGDTNYLASKGAGAATFYGSPGLPGSSARR